jgi:hypothetical protein
MPTQLGFYFGAIIFIIFLISLTYGNNTLMLLAFLLLSQFVLFMIIAHFNLKNFSLKKIMILNGHQGEGIQGHFMCRTPKKCSDINIIFPENINCKLHFSEISEASQLYPLVGIYPKRGLIELDKLNIRSLYPLGLFKTWKIISLPSTFYTYPELKGESLDEYFNKINDGDDLFKEHKQYQAASSYQKINWKHFAKHGHLVLKDFESEQTQDLTFIFNDVEDKHVREMLISQYALWIKLAHHRGLKWKFVDKTKADRTIDDLDRVMEYLACY